MTHLGCVRLAIIGVCTGVLPACFTPSTNRPDRPDARELADAPALAPIEATRPNWSPYAQTREPVNAATAKKTMLPPTPLPERPKSLPDAPKNAAPLQDYDPDLPPAKAAAGAKVRESDKPGASVFLTAKLNEPEKPQVLPLTVMREEPPLMHAMRCYMEKRPDRAIPYLSGFDPENQDVLLNLLPLTALVAEGSLKEAKPQDVAVVVEQLQSLLLMLRPHAALLMDKQCFCRQARKFGAYEPMESQPRFRPGELVEVYFEIRNVTCNRVSSNQGEYQTHTNTTLEIREQSGAFIKKYLPSNKPEYFQTTQHDYFDHYRFQVPPNAPPGKYDLIVEVSDTPTGRKVKQKLEFQVRAN